MESLFSISDKLYAYLSANGIRFNEYGYPIVPKEMLLSEHPDEVIPFFCRNQATHSVQRTVLCFYSNDERIYPRLSKLDEDLDIYRKYMGICGFDLSPRINWDLNLQEFNILLSQLATVYLGLHGIRFFPNFRVGSWETINALSAYPHQSTFSVGTLGCAKGLTEFNLAYMRAKILYSLPKTLLIYGPLRPAYRTALDDSGVDYRVYTDFQKSSRARRRAG